VFDKEDLSKTVEADAAANPATDAASAAAATAS